MQNISRSLFSCILDFTGYLLPKIKIFKLSKSQREDDRSKKLSQSQISWYILQVNKTCHHTHFWYLIDKSIWLSSLHALLLSNSWKIISPFLIDSVWDYFNQWNSMSLLCKTFYSCAHIRVFFEYRWFYL